MKNNLMYILGFGFLAFMWFVKCNSSSEETKKIDIGNSEQVLKSIQGKWNLTYFPQAGVTSHVRVLIEGNTMKTWGEVDNHENGDDYNWNMNQPPENTYTINVGDIADKGAIREIEWEDYGDLTLEQRIIGNMYVTEKGFCHDGRGIREYFYEGWE